MSTFYLMPPRPVMAHRLAEFLSDAFPEMDWSDMHWTDLAETLETAITQHADVFVVYQEEMPDDESPNQVLIEAFGAEMGDEVIEVRSGVKGGPLESHRWWVTDC